MATPCPPQQKHSPPPSTAAHTAAKPPRKTAPSRRNTGLVIVYGASDDLCEFEGAWTDEFSAFGGGEYVYADGGFIKRERSKHRSDNRPRIEQKWCAGPNCCWVFSTHNIPDVSRLTIFEDGTPFSDGLVFRLDDCRPTHCEACGQKLAAG